MDKQNGINVYITIVQEWKKSKFSFSPYLEEVGVGKWLLWR